MCEWLTRVAACSDAEAACVRAAIDGVFRRVLANVLRDRACAAYRVVRRDNAALRRHTAGVPPALVPQLFALLGFRVDEARDAYVCDADDGDALDATLRHADAVLTQLEAALQQRQRRGDDHGVVNVAALRALAQRRTAAARPTVPREASNAEATTTTTAVPTLADDVDAAMVATVRHTLLTTGRLRNSVFDARDLTVRRMTRGRVFACSERCDDACLEVHWHAYSSRNLLYACLAHVSADGARVLHLGYEYGYQYNSIPGTRHFRRTVHFSTKHLTPSGELLRNEHADKPVDACIYCNTPFRVLWA